MAMMRNIFIVPYDPSWPDKFADEARLISEIFQSNLVAIHHVGSTSVPDLASKPVIDILLVVKNLKIVDQKNPDMIQLGYEPKGEFGIPNRRYFSKGKEDARTHHVHTFEPGAPDVANHLNFRDYLINHPKEVAKYAKLKQKLANDYKNDINSYMDGKHSFIREILVRAKKWRLENPDT